MNNPFVVGQNGRLHRPLRPWNEADDAKYYVPVDSTEEQFDLFTKQLSRPDDLVREGRAVLVTGHPGCGKTSLIHRCALWAREALAAQRIRGEIVDLTQDGAQDISVKIRMQRVCSRLIDELDTAELLPRKAMTVLGPVQDEPERVYPRLRTLLHSDAVAIVLLPPSDDLSQEIIEYAKLARPRILFFAESSYAEVARACQAQLRGGSVIYLTVGPIANHDGWAFVANRLTNYATSSAPEIDEATVRRMVENYWSEMSITGLERILFGVFEEAISGSTGRVTYDNITDYFYRTPGSRGG